MNKGFTLIEVLGVITLLAIIAVITVPAVQGVISNSKTKACEQQKKVVIEAAKKWHTDQQEPTISLTDQNSQNLSVTISQLHQAGYLPESPIKNPKNNTKPFNGSVSISFQSTNNQYTYTYSDNTICN